MSDVIQPRDVLPMQLDDGLNHRKLQNMTGTELVVGQLVAVESLNSSGAFLSAQLGIADGTWKQEFLYLAGQGIQDSGTERRDKFRARTFMVLGMDTSLSSIGDPVYLSGTTGGAVTLTAPANIRKVGQVLEVGVAGKVVVAPQAFSGSGNVPFVLDQKWRDEFNGDFEAAGASNIYINNVTGSDTTGTGGPGDPYASLAKAILAIPHHRDSLNLDEITIAVIYTGTAYTWGGQCLVGSLDRIRILGETNTSTNLGQFTPAGVDVSLVNNTVQISNVALAGTLTDQYKGAWLYIGQAGYDFSDPANYAHVNASTYAGGGLHTLFLSDDSPLPWSVPLTLFDVNSLLVKVNLRTGTFTPGDKATHIYDSADLILQSLFVQNMTQLHLQGNNSLTFDGCAANTMGWFLDGGSVRLRKTYIQNSTATPDHGCLDLTNGATLDILEGNTMDGSNVVLPNMTLTTGTLASLWLHQGSQVHVTGGLWLRSHAHIRVDRGTFSRDSVGHITTVTSVQQGGPGYTAPGYITALGTKAPHRAGNYPAGEVALYGPTLTNYDYLIAAAGHDMTVVDSGDLVTSRTPALVPWVSADGGVSPCSYDPGKGTRLRINDPLLTGMRTELPKATVDPEVDEAVIDWARGEDQLLDLDAQAATKSTTLGFRHPRLGGTTKLWVRSHSAVGLTHITWPAKVTWSAGTPPGLASTTYSLYAFEYLPLLDTYYGRHVEVDVT